MSDRLNMAFVVLWPMFFCMSWVCLFLTWCVSEVNRQHHESQIKWLDAQAELYKAIRETE